MGIRSYPNDMRHATQGAVLMHFSFVTNNTSAPDTTLFRGEGIASVARTGVGKFVVTLQEGFRYIVAAHASIADAGTPDGKMATVGAPGSEGANTTPVTFQVNVTNADGTTAADTTSRRVSLSFCAKNSGVGK